VENETVNALTIWESPEALEARIKRMLEIQQNVMKKDIDYGIIPGCDKPSLYKPGAELLMVTFGLSDRLEVEDLSSEDRSEIRYRIKSEIYAQGIYLGCGIGEASTNQDKYKWREAICDEEFEATPVDQKRIKWFKGKPPYTKNQIRTNPSDLANTVLKMAKKSSKIDAVLSVLGASRIYTQDLGDMSKELQEMLTDNEKKGKKKSSKPDTTPTTPMDETGVIESVEVKTGKGKKGEWTLYDIKISGTTYGTFDKKIGEAAVEGKTVLYTWKKEGKYNTLTSIHTKVDQAPAPKMEEKPKEEGHKILTREEFEAQIANLALQAGQKTTDETNNFIMENSDGKYKSVSDIPEDDYSQWLDMFQAEAESKK